MAGGLVAAGVVAVGPQEARNMLAITSRLMTNSEDFFILFLLIHGRSKQQEMGGTTYQRITKALFLQGSFGELLTLRSPPFFPQHVGELSLWLE